MNPTNPEKPHLIGDLRSPVECLSSTGLMRVPDPIIWDVNGYYRELGVDPRATRREIMRAYVALDGSSSTRLTYIVKQLLNPEVRSAYDACPFGSEFWDDYKQEESYRRTLNLMNEHIAVAESNEEIHEIVDLVQEGIRLAKEAQLREPLIDIKSVKEQYDSTHWGWSYYLWNTEIEDIDLLSKWQGELAVHLSRRGVETHFAVGLMENENDSNWIVKTVGHRIVAFLRVGGSLESRELELAALAIEMTEQTLENDYDDPFFQ